MVPACQALWWKVREGGNTRGCKPVHPYRILHSSLNLRPCSLTDAPPALPLPCCSRPPLADCLHRHPVAVHNCAEHRVCAAHPGTHHLGATPLHARVRCHRVERGACIHAETFVASLHCFATNGMSANRHHPLPPPSAYNVTLHPTRYHILHHHHSQALEPGHLDLPCGHHRHAVGGLHRRRLLTAHTLPSDRGEPQLRRCGCRYRQQG